VSDTFPLPDGEYPVFVVDVEESDRPDGTVSKVSVTILTGDHKGDVLDLAAAGLQGSFIDLIGMPGTLTVRDGEPGLSVDD
jgi:hypothetical protein